MGKTCSLVLLIKCLFKLPTLQHVCLWMIAPARASARRACLQLLLLTTWLQGNWRRSGLHPTAKLKQCEFRIVAVGIFAFAWPDRVTDLKQSKEARFEMANSRRQRARLCMMLPAVRNAGQTDHHCSSYMSWTSHNVTSSSRLKNWKDSEDFFRQKLRKDSISSKMALASQSK